MLTRLSSLFGPRDSLSRLLVTSSLWSIVLRVAGGGLGFVVGVQLARYLKPAGLGIYGVVFGLAMMLTAVAQLGLPMLATREVSVSRTGGDWARLRGVLRWFSVAVLACGGLLGLIFAAVAALLPTAETGFRGASYWAAASIPLTALTILLNAELRGLDRLLKGQSLEILVRPAGMSLLLLGVFLAAGRMSPAAAMATSFGASLLAVAVGLLWLRAALPPEARRARPVRETRLWAAAAAPLAVTEVLRQLDSVYGVLVMGALTTAAETGIFRVAASSVVVIAMPLSVLHVVLAPTLARLHASGDSARLQSILSISAAAMFTTAAAGALVLVVAGEPLLTILFGAEYAPSWAPLVILTGAHAVNGFFGVGWVLLAMSGGEKQLVRCFIASVSASIAAAVPMTLAWGAPGAAIAAVIGSLVNNLWAWHFVRRRYGLDCSLLGALPLLARMRKLKPSA